ncbi:hypothetical protein Goshw_011183, partial [Gossypium schwendimanii]|nr:hypothetical protein [Gossypium schwendimanii]
ILDEIRCLQKVSSGGGTSSSHLLANYLYTKLGEEEKCTFSSGSTYCHLCIRSGNNCSWWFV